MFTLRNEEHYKSEGCADHLREAYLALTDQDAAGADVHAGLLMVPVAGFETALAHVVSTYSAAAKELAGICSDLGSQVENAAMTPADLRRRGVPLALCHAGLSYMRERERGGGASAQSYLADGN